MKRYKLFCFCISCCQTYGASKQVACLCPLALFQMEPQISKHRHVLVTTDQKPTQHIVKEIGNHVKVLETSSCNPQTGVNPWRAGCSKGQAGSVKLQKLRVELALDCCLFPCELAICHGCNSCSRHVCVLSVVKLDHLFWTSQERPAIGDFHYGLLNRKRTVLDPFESCKRVSIHVQIVHGSPSESHQSNTEVKLTVADGIQGAHVTSRNSPKQNHMQLCAQNICQTKTMSQMPDALKHQADEAGVTGCLVAQLWRPTVSTSLEGTPMSNACWPHNKDQS